MTPEPVYRCADASQRRGDDLVGTAPTAGRFLLLEQPGSWGRVAAESGLPPVVGRELLRACESSATRLLLIRRPGREQPPVRRRWYLATTTPGSARLRSGTLGDDADALRLLAGDEPGDPEPGPLFAVCTHGRHDACCAIRGRPVARALAAALGESAWEVSHLGGDRFAGNALVLPWGLYYGRVDEGNVGALVAETAAGRVIPELFRGCSAFPAAGQAAQAFVRARTGRRELGAHRPTSVHHTHDHVWEVGFDDGSAATVQRSAGGPPALLTCAAVAPLSPPTWTLLDLRV